MAIAAVCGLFLLATAGIAAAHGGAKITSGPTITGVAQEGETLTAAGTWKGTPAPVETWQWIRCKKPDGGCQPIAGATGISYVAAAADVNMFLRVRLTVTNSAGSDSKRSAPTAAVAAKTAPPPPPTTTPPPEPEPEPETPATPTTPTPAFELPATQPPSDSSEDVVEATVPMLQPFPTVRIKGRLTPTGARVTLLRVRAQRGLQITVTCRGRSCPVREVTRRAAGSTRVRQFERRLRAGTRLLVQVTKAGHVGKWTEITIRRGMAPRRWDGCLEPGSSRAVQCPAA
jgi:hypothetical protein